MARAFSHISLLLIVLSLTACGDEPASTDHAATPDPTPSATATATATPPEASAPSAPTPPADVPTATPTGEAQEGGGGDEAEARVPVAVTVGTDGTVSPRTVSVPAFLALELQVRNRTPGPIQVTWEGATAAPFEVAAGTVATHRVAGVRPGRYRLLVQGAGTAVVIAGAEPGP